MRQLLVTILVVGTVSACDKIPGTDAYERRTSIEGAEAAAAYILIDPSSAQFRNLTLKNNTACGEVNGKNRMGAYVGFVRFIADREDEKWKAKLDPQFDVEEYNRAKRDCDLAASTHNPALGQVACMKAIEMTPEQIPQFVFDYAWKNYCKAE